MRCVAVFFALLLIAARPAVAGESSLTDRAGMLLDYQSFMRGDCDGAVRFALNASKDLHGTPLAELAVRIALLYETQVLSSVGVGETEARRILGTDANELAPEHRDLLRRFVARNYVTAGRREEAMEVHRRRGLAMSWLIAGPFHGRKAASFESHELPEGGVIFDEDVIENPPDAERFREWRKRPPWLPLPQNRSFPFVRPWRRGLLTGDGSMLMFTGLDMSAADNRAFFHVYSEASWQLYVDGSLVAEMDRNSREAPIEHMVPFPLSAGKHSVTLQLFPRGADVRHGDVRVAVRLESSVPFVWDRNAVRPEKRNAVTARREPRPMRYFNELSAAAKDSPMLMTAYAVACLEQGMPDTAAWWGERAAMASPGAASLQLFAGITASLNPLLPDERRRDLALAWHSRALKTNPDIVPSLVFLARSASALGKARESLQYLERAYKVNPASIEVLLERGEWASRFASGATARTAWDECGKAFPDSPSVQIAIASMRQDGFLDMERRLAACRAAVEAGPYLPEASLRLAEALADSGNNQEAESVLGKARDLFAGEVGVMAEIAEIYARLSLYEAATGIVSEAVRLAPEDDALWRRLGDLHMAAGDEAKAMKYWRVSLAANPGQFELSDMMDYLSNSPSRLYNEGGYDAIAMTASVDVENYPSDVVRLLDRSVLMFAQDGSYRRSTHEIDLARTRRGGESLAGFRQHGELLTARIVFPNGNTLEPEPFPGQGGLRLPVIMPGASREVRTLESVTTDWSETPTIKPWFFQDPSGRMPLLISEYVVRTPRGFPLVYVVQNLGRNVEFEFIQEEDADVYRWTANLNLPWREPDAVHISERVPSVEIGVKTTWDDVAFRELRKLDGRLIPSMEMRQLADSLSKPTPGTNPNPEQTARAIYRYVCDNIDPTPTNGIAAHIQTERMGDRSVLLLALLRAAGLDADPAAARPAVNFMHPPSWDLPKRDIFPISLVRLTIPGGKVSYLDVRFDSLPFGKITDDLSGATVIAFLADGPLFETLPILPAEDSIILKERTIRLPTASGMELEAVGRSIRRDVNGLRRSETLADADPAGRRNMILAAVHPVFPDAVLQRFDVLRQEDNEASATERYEITTKAALEERPNGVLAVLPCLLPPQVIAPETRNLAHRNTTCHIKSVHMAEDRNIFMLPEGGRFVRLPEPAHIPSRFGVYQLRVLTRGEKSIELQRTYHIPAQRVPPWDWTEFLNFLERIDLAERQWIEYTVE